MRKVIKIGFPIVCISIVGITFFLLNRAMNKVNKNNWNTSETVKNNVEENSNEIDTENSTSQKKVYTVSDDEKRKELEKENEKNQKAIDIVKQKDGNRTNTYYSNEGEENGEYIVAIRDIQTTKAIIYYIVNLEEETARIYY